MVCSDAPLPRAAGSVSRLDGGQTACSAAARSAASASHQRVARKACKGVRRVPPATHADTPPPSPMLPMPLSASDNFNAQAARRLDILESRRRELRTALVQTEREELTLNHTMRRRAAAWAATPAGELRHLIESNDRLRKDLYERNAFIVQYALDRPAAQRQRFTVDSERFLVQMKLLAAVARSEWSPVVHTVRPGRGIYRSASAASRGGAHVVLQYRSAVSVTLYRDGIAVDGRFRPFGRIAVDAFVADIVDGYFPEEYRETHPNGVVFAPIVDRHQVVHDAAAGVAAAGVSKGVSKEGEAKRNATERRGGRSHAATVRAAARRDATDCLNLLVRSLDGRSTLHLRALPDDSALSVFVAVRAEWPALALVSGDGDEGGALKLTAEFAFEAARAAPRAWTLTCDGRELEGGSATLAEQGLRDRSTLRVLVRKH